ncbi:fimbria/pilus outer membrane usher protein [Zavarzinia compransoris]|uniref:fimbria/pilus outer membrane usher protein n=1 Tax=Zavarzinia marina TaxID=2911065 RepID=UPI001F3B6931|nr:fimbria/pilus outer membrane usher protein [Zavarzinia marina]MCF4165010.1 fimbria/pilus outer membrane usher protein [Zavarzinia marina]
MPVRSIRASAASDGLIPLVAGIVAGFVVSVPVGSMPAARAETAPDDVFLAGFEVNGRASDLAGILRRRGDEFLIRDSDLATLRLNIPSVPGIEIEGDVYRPVSALKPTMVRFDTERQVLILDLPSTAMQAISIDLGRRPTALPTSDDWSLFLNYEAAVTGTDDYALGNGALEAAVSGPQGTIVASGLGHARLDGGWGGDGGVAGPPRGVRLETHYTYDNPRDQTRLRLGDGVTGRSSIGQQIRFAGFQFSSDFNLRPGQFVFAAPGLSGYLDGASSVALYVDNILRYTGQLPAGPFSFNDLPVTTGAGETRLVATDLLGREQVITSSYYVGGDSLAAGRQSFSYEFGVERRNYGSASNDYGDGLAAFTHRLGLTDWLTGEVHGEWQAERWQAGLGAVLVLPAVGQISGTYARSDSDALGPGWLWNLEAQRLGRLGSVSLQWERASDSFSQFGTGLLDGDEAHLVGRAQANAGVNLGRFGSLSFGYGRLRFSDGTRPEVSTASYALRVTERSTLSVIGARTDTDEGTADDTGRSVAVTWTTVFSPRRSANLQYQDSDGDTQVTVGVNRQHEGLYGIGYDLRGHYDADEDLELLGRVDYQTTVGNFGAVGSVRDDREAVQVSASGAVVAAGGGVFASEPIHDSVAVVTVPDYPEVTVYRDNQAVGETGADGRLLIPNVRAYEENEIRLEPRDLPIDAGLDSDRVLIVPRNRGAVVARFPVKRQSSAILVIERADGSFPPPGAGVTFDGGVDPSFTGYDGEVFVSDLSAAVTGTIAYGGLTCRFEAPAKPKDAGALPRLGPFPCTEEAR